MSVDYRKLLESIMDAIGFSTLVDAKGNILYMSRRYCEEEIGLPQEEIIGKPITEIVPDSRIPAILAGGKPVMGEYYHLDRLDRDVFANRMPLYVNGELQGLFAEVVLYSISDVERLNEIVEKISVENTMLREKLDVLRKSQYNIDHIIGTSEPIRHTKQLVSQFADTNLSILISGETGTGKEICADVIQGMSKRWDKPYVKINCAAIPENLLESELFGYEKGAFTGASDKGKIGKFEYANGGTILLDEISEMSPSLQAKLLRVLQDKCLERVGGVQSIPLDVRIICSTNQDLKEAVHQGKFRSDLYYRINTVEINIPPLRERPEDIEPLCEYFIEKANQENGIFISGIQESALKLLEEYDWEGNIRELEHVIERACVSAGAGELHINHFGFLLERLFSASDPSRSGDASNNLSEKTMGMEREEIIKAIVAADGNKSQAANLLGINRSVLYQKIKKHNIKI